MANRTQKGIVVVGDVTMDWNIGRLPSSQDTTQSWNSENLIRASVQRGGAAFIAELIGGVLNLDSVKPRRYALTSVKVPRVDSDISPNDPRYHHSYARWELFEFQKKTSGADKGVLAWRVKDFIGLQQRGEPDQGVVLRQLR